MKHKIYIAVLLVITALLVYFIELNKPDFDIENIEKNEVTKIIFSVNDVEGNKLISHRSDEAFHPGSNIKLITTAVAKNTLGFDYKYLSKLYERGDELLIMGGGDVGLMEYDLDEIVKNLNGEYKKLYYLDDYFAPRDLTYDYTRVVVSGLQLNEGFVDVSIGDGYKTWPLKNIEIEDNVDYKDYGDEILGIEGHFDNDKIVLEGSAYKDSYLVVPVPMKDPALITAKTFAQKLGIGEVVRLDDFRGDWTFLYQHESDPLWVYLKEMLVKSKNIYGFSIFKSFSEEKSDEASVDLVMNFLNRQGISTDGLAIYDGAGINPNTKIKTQTFFDVFEYFGAESSFWELLPVSGKSGTLEARFKTGFLGYKVLAKTGTHLGSSTLSGRIVRPFKKDLYFVINVTDDELSNSERVVIIDKVVDSYVRSL